MPAAHLRKEGLGARVRPTPPLLSVTRAAVDTTGIRMVTSRALMHVIVTRMEVAAASVNR